MTDLRKAAEMALEALETLNAGDSYKTHTAAAALRQALQRPVKSYTNGEPQYAPNKYQCVDHPDAPHGFDRSASFAQDRYVCECESWNPKDKEQA
jgi:hypothetical protein